MEQNHKGTWCMVDSNLFCQEGFCSECEINHARKNRERIKQGYCNEFYDQQAHILRSWTGKEPPAGLVLGDIQFHDTAIARGGFKDIGSSEGRLGLTR